MFFTVDATALAVANPSVTVLIPSSAGITVPAGGANRVSNPISMTISQENSNVSIPVAFEPIGGLAVPPSFRMDPILAGRPTSITMTFALSAALQEFESVFIELPGFTGEPSAQVALQPGYINPASAQKLTAIWTQVCPQQVLAVVVKAGEQVSARELINFVVPESAGISLPAAGLAASASDSRRRLLQFSSGIGLWTDGASGPITSDSISAVSDITRVGAFDSSELRYFPAPGEPLLAGGICKIELRITATMNLAVGDILVLSAPFVAEDAEMVLTGAASHGWWEYGKLYMNISTNVRANTAARISVPVQQEMRLPTEGIDASDPEITLSAIAVDGDVPRTRVQTVQAVGTFTDSSTLSFLPAKAGAVATLNVAFRPAMLVKAAETVRLTLPGFTGPYATYVKVRWNDGTARASWSESHARLDLTVPSDVMPNELVTVVVTPSKFQIALPLEGVRTSDPIFKIWTNAMDGPVANTPIVSTAPVGSFMTTPTLVFDVDARPGAQTRISFSCVPQMEIAIGETITLRLPGFTGGSDGPLDGFLNSSVLYAASWNAGSTELEFTAGVDIEVGTSITAEIDANAAIKLPVDGVRQNQINVYVSTNAVAGPIIRTPGTTVSSTQAVGSFVSSTALSYAPRYFGEPTSITLTFRAEMNLTAGDTVTLDLPEFGLNASTSTVLQSTPEGAFATASWNATSHLLSLLVGENVARQTDVIVIVPSTAGIALPPSGIRSENALRIRTDAALGPVPWTSVTNSPSVGAFAQLPRIDFAPRKAETLSVLSFTFEVFSDLVYDDVMLIKLPKFVALDTVEVVSLVAPICPYPIWDEDMQSLLVSFCGSFRAGETFFAKIRNLQIPEMGIAPGTTALTLTINSTYGDIPEMPFVEVPPVGAIHAEMSFP